MPSSGNGRETITNQALRELSRVNGLLVGEWIKTHADEVISHNSKHGILILRLMNLMFFILANLHILKNAKRISGVMNSF